MDRLCFLCLHLLSSIRQRGQDNNHTLCSAGLGGVEDGDLAQWMKELVTQAWWSDPVNQGKGISSRKLSSDLHNTCAVSQYPTHIMHVHTYTHTIINTSSQKGHRFDQHKPTFMAIASLPRSSK